MTAEEFVRNKLKELYPKNKTFTLDNEFISADMAMRWVHEFKKLDKPEKDETTPAPVVS